MKFFTVFIASLLLVLALHEQAKVVKVADLVADLQNDTVLVETEDARGSGVMVTRGGVTYVWTAAHVVLTSQRVTLEQMLTGTVPAFTPSLNTNICIVWHGQTNQASVIDYTSPRGPEGHRGNIDIALLRIWKENLHTPSVQFQRGAPLEAGAKIWHVGNFFGPQGLNSVVTGIIAYPGRNAEGEVNTQVQCPIYPGSSGGGVFDEYGQCIGLADARIEECMGFIVPIQAMRIWASFHNVTFALNAQ